jgi:Co/Zn/Cd efflux system component
MGLLSSTSAVLLDRQAANTLQAEITNNIEDADNHVADLHVWAIGPGIYAAIVSVVSRVPAPPDTYKKRLPANLGLVHVTVEVHKLPDETPGSRTDRNPT